MALLQAFLRSLGDGDATLDAVKACCRAEPMCLEVKDRILEHEGKRDHLVLFKYNQTRTKFGDEQFGGLCREARGIILRMDTWDIVCYPFDKFFNAEEGHADDIDWRMADVQEKLDGSLLKVWYNSILEQWIVSTNGMIDARDCSRSGKAGTFHDLFCEAAAASGLDYACLDRSHTYCFELLHPENTVVIRHPRPRLVHLGTRDTTTLQELLDEDIGVERPAVFPLHDFGACRRAAAVLPENCEGYVVVDRNRSAGRVRRVKIKSPKYVALHHMKCKLVSPEEACAVVLLTGEESEVEAYRETPEIKDFFDVLVELRRQCDNLVARMENSWAEVLDTSPEGRGPIRKHFALEAARLPKPCRSMWMSRAGQLSEGRDLSSWDALIRAHATKRATSKPDATVLLAMLRSSGTCGGA